MHKYIRKIEIHNCDLCQNAKTMKTVRRLIGNIQNLVSCTKYFTIRLTCYSHSLFTVSDVYNFSLVDGRQ